MWIKISIAMLAFAANSLLCRLALAEQQIDPMSFSLLRVGSGVVCLGLFYAVLQVVYQYQNGGANNIVPFFGIACVA